MMFFSCTEKDLLKRLKKPTETQKRFTVMQISPQIKKAWPFFADECNFFFKRHHEAVSVMQVEIRAQILFLGNCETRF